MPKAARLALIDQLQQERHSHVITYVTSTRAGLEVAMAMDAIRKIYEHLRLAEPKDWGSIDLFLYSNGGDGTVPWRLVTLLREKAKRLSVLIPFRAFSAATLTALGADAVVMHPMGILGPTDPTVGNPFNPPDPANPPEKGNPGQRIGISVEDVTAFLALIREDAGIRHDDELVLAFNKLAEQVHPLALGHVKRSLSQSRMMAKKLLSLHMDVNREEHRIQEIVDSLTSKLFYHGHPINRDEARNSVGLATVEDPTKRVERLMWDLYLDYEQEIKLEEPFNPVFEFLAKNPGLPPAQMPAMPPGLPPGAIPALAALTPIVTPLATAKLAFIESERRTDVLSLDYELSGQRDPTGQTRVNFLPRRQSWLIE